MITIIITCLLSAGASNMVQPAEILTPSTRESLSQDLKSGRASPDEVLWFTVDAIARKVKTPELERLIKILEGSPYAELGDPLVSACHYALIIDRGNNSWLFVFEILWVSLGSRELDMVVKLYPEDWRFRLVRGTAHYWTPGNYGKIGLAWADLEFVFNVYSKKYGWDETLAWIRLWEGNLARRKGDLKAARQLWQSTLVNGGNNTFQQQATMFLQETQGQ